ncbi:hypothetical protein BCR32DRAFT_196269, partial [Anaeromyces robustus]
VDLLISNGADIHQRDIRNCTPLIHSIKRRNIDIIKYLVQKGADINVQDDQGQTPL